MAISGKLLLSLIGVAVLFSGAALLAHKSSESSTARGAHSMLRQELFPKTSRVSYIQFQECFNTQCKTSSVCPRGDRACRAASQLYTDCQANSTACQLFKQEYGQDQAADPLPISFYDCNTNCRPNKNTAGFFWEIYKCRSNCGGILIPSIYDFEYCRATQCRLQCPDGDTNCYKTSQQHQTCLRSQQICLSSVSIIEQSYASDPLPREFYECDRLCRPSKQTSKFYYDNFYVCNGQCAGLDYSLTDK